MRNDSFSSENNLQRGRVAQGCRRRDCSKICTSSPRSPNTDDARPAPLDSDRRLDHAREAQQGRKIVEERVRHPTDGATIVPPKEQSPVLIARGSHYIERMASKQGNVDFVLEQMAEAGPVSARKMFGEYGIYCGEKLVALFCDDQLFIKPTDAGRAFIGTVTEGAPYPGAKPWLLIGGDLWEDGEWLSELVRTTFLALPPPKPKPMKKRAQKPDAAKPKSSKKTAKTRAVPKAKAKANAASSLSKSSGSKRSATPVRGRARPGATLRKKPAR